MTGKARSGRPETPVPADADAKELAEFLRALRHAAGSPAYRTLGAGAWRGQSSMSKTANGRVPEWQAVEIYQAAVTAWAEKRAVDLAPTVRCHTPPALAGTSVNVVEIARVLHERGQRRRRTRQDRATDGTAAPTDSSASVGSDHVLILGECRPSCGRRGAGWAWLRGA
jgi:hypothetical protein